MSDDIWDQPALKEPRVAFRDLRITDTALRSSLLDSVGDVLENGPILMGPRVEQFEQRMAAYCGRGSAVGVASGTCALYLALRALGIGPGDELLTSPMSWVATLNAIVMTGAQPVFVDVGEDQNINPALLVSAITQRTRAIVPVHFTGRLCDMTAIAEVAREHDLLIIEDAAQAMGTQRNTYRVGSVGDAAAFSLNPMKVFPGFGEAGAVVTDDAAIDKRLRALRYLGTERKEVCIEISLNHKMDEIQAALMLPGFDRIDDLVESRISMARRYSERLRGIVGCPSVPSVGDQSSNFFDYVIFCEDREGLRYFLHAQGIETKVKHPVLLCDHPAYPCEPRPQIPVADRLASQMISLPLHDKLRKSDIDYVCDEIRRYCNGK